MTARRQPPADVVAAWTAFAAIGAGLVHAATAGALASAALAVAALGLAGVTLVRGAVPSPKVVAAASAAPVVTWLATRVTGAEPVGTADALVTVLHAAVAALCLVAARASVTDPPAGRGSAAGRLGMLAAGALVMAAVTTPALAATEAGEHARPHGHTATSP
ncbi:MAG: hypothetical protein ACLGIV_14620 [Actinomycetes bacterium]